MAPGEEIAAYPFVDDLGKLNHEARSFPLPAAALRLALLHAVNWLGPAALDAVTSGSNIFHASNLSHHGPRRARLTATVHDLTTFLMPELHTSANIRADRTFSEQILRRANGLIAVSENTRQDAIRMLGIAPERIVTIHSGVAHEYFNPPPTSRPKQYALFVGAIEPRKNLETLLDAWRLMKQDLREAFDLVIAGPMAWASEATRERIRKETGSYLWLRSRGGFAGLDRGRDGLRLPLALRGLRISGGAGHGRGRTCDRVEHIPAFRKSLAMPRC